MRQLSMKRPKLLAIWFIALSMVACATLIVLRRASLNEGVQKVALDGADLWVPDRYLKVQRFPWVEMAAGLDRNRHSFRVEIPYREVACRFKGNADGDVDVVVNVLPLREFREAAVQMASVVDEARVEK